MLLRRIRDSKSIARERAPTGSDALGAVMEGEKLLTQ
jgi:hypothetical protein